MSISEGDEEYLSESPEVSQQNDLDVSKLKQKQQFMLPAHCCNTLDYYVTIKMSYLFWNKLEAVLSRLQQDSQLHRIIQSYQMRFSEHVKLYIKLKSAFKRWDISYSYSFCIKNTSSVHNL